MMGTADINVYDEEAYMGDSILPFIGFCLFVAALVIIFLAVVNLISVWRDFRIFYDAAALDEKPDASEKKQKMKKYIIMAVVGIVLLIVSEIIL